MDGSSVNPSIQRPSPNACLPCRKVKMKCRPNDDDEDSRCKRCARKSLACIFQEHQRGRKPGTRIPKRKDAPVMTVPALSGCESGYAESFDNSKTPASHSMKNVAVPEQETLQPSGLRNCDLLNGGFSLGHILSAGDSHPFEPRNGSSFPPTEDPIRLGHINLSIAKSLFQNFIDVLNTYISQLDPALHTFAYVRQKSSFLFSAILTMSAKTFNPALYKRLYNHTQSLFVDVFRSGKRSTEIVQAILILTYWKEPEDTRAWTSLGYVIRMCMDLGWHKMISHSSQSRASMTEIERREVRNIERTWYVLFVYDRSMSLQMGKPWMIEHSDFVESIESWCKDPMATSNDHLLGAFVTLRKITSLVYNILSQESQRSDGDGSLCNVESLLNIINGHIKAWENVWVQAMNKEDESCHPFMIRFYGTHLQLQLFSIPLQAIFNSGDRDLSLHLQLLWVAYSSAIETLQLLSRYSSYLYFVQDSVHVMVAYSVQFLIKLLLSAPPSIVSQIESNTINAIRATAHVFSQQNSPPGSSCALQAKFLDKAVSDFSEKRKERLQNSNIDPGNLAGSAAHLKIPEALRRGQWLPNNLSQLLSEAGGAPAPESHPLLQADNSGFVVTDEDVWANIFVGAGFFPS